MIPLELDEIYPLSQHEIVKQLDLETIDDVAEQVKDYIAASNYKKVFLVENEIWKGKVSKACKLIQRKDLSITTYGLKEIIDEDVLKNILEIIRKLVI